MEGRQSLRLLLKKILRKLLREAIDAYKEARE